MQARSVLVLASLAILLTACSSVEIASVTDREFQLMGTGTPFRTVLVAYDGSDIVRKERFEAAFAEYIDENTTARAIKEIELFPPMRNIDSRERASRMKDEGVDAVLVIDGGSLSKPSSWSLSGTSDLQNIDAWRSMPFRLVQAATGKVVWMGGVVGSQGGAVLLDELSRSLVAEVGAALLSNGFLAVREKSEPMMRGFN